MFAVIMPNVQGLEHDWRPFAVTVREVEKLTGYNFFNTLPAAVAKELKDRKPETRAKKGGAGELAAFEKGCIIGNRNSKIYHVPDGSGYEKAKTSKNAVFFKSVNDAEKAGYRAAKR